MSDDRSSNETARTAWDENAEFWDARMGDGTDFFELLLWPSVERLLGNIAGKRVLDVACGNGVTSRRLAGMGAAVTAVDLSTKLLGRARARASVAPIDYRVVDVTSREMLLALGTGFDAALCNMALMDIAELEPLVDALAQLLVPGGSFVFSLLHPCFNNPATVQLCELQSLPDAHELTYSVKTSRYLTPFTQLGIAMPGQPAAHPYFHRSLADLLGPAFKAGLVLDGFEETAFPPGHTTGSTPVSWSGNFSEIPPVVVARLRRPVR